MHQISIPLGGSTLSIECGRLAKQANGSAYVRYGDTVVLATACTAAPREGIDFFPLTVDYREDYELVAAIFAALYPKEKIFSLGSILDFLRDHEEVSRLNAGLNGVNWYRHHLSELRTIRPEETRVEGGLR